MNGLLDPLLQIVLVPLVSALGFVLIASWRIASWLNIAVSGLTFLNALRLVQGGAREGEYLFADDLNLFFVLLTSFVAFTTSLFSAKYIAVEIERGNLSPRLARFYHAMYQSLLFGMLLALLANNIGVMWVAVELATLSTISIVGLYQTPEGLEAAWKYFILGSVGIALALFGTILIYMAAEPVVGEGYHAMVWNVLTDNAAAFSPRLLNVAFVFLILGYGTKLGLVPVHGWLPDAHGEGPTPVTAVLSGLMLNVALYAVLRFKMLLSLNAGAIAPGPILMTLGMASLTFAAFMLYRRDDIKRLFAYSSIEHMGLIAIAFGIGGHVANFAGLLHVAMHSLTKSAIFFCVGHIAQFARTQKMSRIHGLTQSYPLLGWMLVISVIAIVGLPPFGLFTSEFLIVQAALTLHPAIAVLIVLLLLVAFAALMLRLTGLAFGEPHGHFETQTVAIVPMVLHLSLVLSAGLFIPAQLTAWIERIARLLG